MFERNLFIVHHQKIKRISKSTGKGRGEGEEEQEKGDVRGPMFSIDSTSSFPFVPAKMDCTNIVREGKKPPGKMCF